MALQNREICKVGESPTTERRTLSPRRGMSVVTDCPEVARGPQDPSQDMEPPRSPKLAPSPSSSACTSPSKSERKISTRLLMMQKGDVSKSPTKSPKHAAWKTSKFFSRSMASGELLKGFKKITTSVSASNAAAAEEVGPSGNGSSMGSTDAASKESDASKSFKNRFSSLRRKSGSDSDSVPNVDSESLKLGSAEIRGIVCKKEDLMSLMTKVPKERRVSTPLELTVPFQSSLPTSPIPVLKSPSIKVAPNSPLNRGSFRTRSASLDPTSLPNERLCFSPQVRPPVRTLVTQPPRPIIRRGVVTDDICIKSSTFLEVVPEVKRRLSGPLIEIKERIVEETESEIREGGASSDNDPPVQWDDSNFVDPNLLGGAIEAFLRGMGSSPSQTPSTEKRVSFKKNLVKQ